MEGFEDDKIIDGDICNGNALPGRKIKNNSHPDNGRSPIINEFLHGVVVPFETTCFILRKISRVVKREKESKLL